MEGVLAFHPKGAEGREEEEKKAVCSRLMLLSPTSPLTATDGVEIAGGQEAGGGGGEGGEEGGEGRAPGACTGGLRADEGRESGDEEQGAEGEEEKGACCQKSDLDLGLRGWECVFE